MENSCSQFAALVQGLAWLKEQQDEAIQLCYQALQKLGKSKGWQMPDRMLQVIAKGNIEGFIGRLEGQALKTENVKQLYAENIARGATIENSMLIMDSLLATLTDKVQQDLSKQPEVSRVLIEKASYFNNLIKATLATAHIELTSHKGLEPHKS